MKFRFKESLNMQWSIQIPEYDTNKCKEHHVRVSRVCIRLMNQIKNIPIRKLGEAQ